ncbi:GyrI-like domain-containing protein [Paenibacillus sp. SYP-B4298]|uniref:GyrI-like domain-containing protein n=1 Tax=Paenibacillus sp. SYP-B4298 TaxID=2996034 RepID=UPI0022DD14C5|nr:GyrI-like domain-containing protein [Paenibacillus sp. SYP-B4298]
MSQNNVVASFEIEVVNREYKLVGMSITGNYPDSFPEVAVTIQRAFWDRRKEIKNSKDYDILFSPGMCNGIVATYFACTEVTDIGEVPEGMLAFTLPDMEYVKIACTNKTIAQGYDKLFEWMKQNQYEHRFYNACQIEIFYIDEEAEEEPVDILIPLSKVKA